MASACSPYLPATPCCRGEKEANGAAPCDPADNSAVEGHYIVVGMGRVGYRIVDLLLRLGERVTVVTEDSREEWLRSVCARGVTPIRGDARSENRLIEAGIHSAKAIIAATDQDLVNIEVALDAKQLRPDVPVVMRLFDPSLARELEAGFSIRRALGVSALAAPTFAAAALGEQVVGAFTLEGAMYVIGRVMLDSGCPLTGMTVEAAAERFEVAVLAQEHGGASCQFAPPGSASLEAGGRLTVVARKHRWDVLAETPGPQVKLARHGVPLRRWLRDHLHLSALPEFFSQIWKNTATPLRTVFLLLLLLIVLSVFVFRAGMGLSLIDALYFVMTTVTTVGYGDITPKESANWLKAYACLLMLLGSAFIATLYSILTDYLVTARFQQLLGRQRLPQAGHVIVVGLGSVGYRVVEELRQAGARVVGIDRDSSREFVEALRHQVPVIAGDARAAETLARASLSTASAVVAATADDTVNLSVALAAERTNPQVRTVCRLFDADFARKVQSALSVDVALGASRIAAPSYVASAFHEGVLGAFELDDALFAVLTHSVGDEWHGRTPAALAAAGEGRVLMRRGAGEKSYRIALDERPMDRGDELVVAVRRAIPNS